MPHVTVEYTDNLEAEADIPGLLRKIAARLAESDGVFPVAGIRVRAVRLSEYVVADGGDNGFVHATIKVAPGRSQALMTPVFEAMFELMTIHFAGLMSRRPLALSLDVETSEPIGPFRRHNLGPEPADG